MALLVAGHVRSGTTLLRQLCDGHPELAVTDELGSFLALDRPFHVYCRQILKRWREVRNARAFDSSADDTRWKSIPNLAFVSRYLFKIYQRHSGLVDRAAIEATLHTIFPRARIVGDKWPDYVFRLDALVKADVGFLVVIYRDCRDVVGSTLERRRTAWQGARFRHVDSAEQVARRWVRAIEAMEHHRASLYVIQYEDLIREPKRELAALGEWLGVDPSGFPAAIVRPPGIGHRLSDEELAMVIEVSGPAMARLGYL